MTPSLRDSLAQVVALALALVLSGCQPYQFATWETASSTHVCSEAQMQRVEREHLFCVKNAGTIAAACYGTAILRNCTHRRDIVGGVPKDSR